MMRTSITAAKSAAFVSFLMTTSHASAHMLPHKACPSDTTEVENAMKTAAGLSALNLRVEDAFQRVLQLTRGVDQRTVAFRERNDWVCGVEQHCGQYRSLETGMDRCLREELSKRADILENVAQIEQARQANDGSSRPPAALACPTPGIIPDCALPLDLAAERGAKIRVPGRIGKVQQWTYSVSVAAGDTVAVRFSGPRGGSGTIKCPEDPDTNAQFAAAVGPFDAAGSLKSKAAGYCLISVGFDEWVQAVPGPFDLTVERQ